MRKNLRLAFCFMMFLLFLGGCGKSVEKQITEQLNLGQKYLAEANYEEAIVAFNKVIELDPKQVDAYAGMIETYVQMDEYEQAVSIYEEGAERLGETASKELETIKTTLVDQLGKAAENLMEEGEYERAEAIYQLKFRLDESSPEAVLGLVDCLLSQGEFDEAENALEDGLDKNPKDELLLEKEQQFEKGQIKDYKGRILKNTWYYADGTLSSYSISEYDDRNNSSKTIYYDKDGNTENEEYTFYDGEGKRIKQERYAAEGYLMQEGSYIEAGVWRTTAYRADGTINYIEDSSSEGARTYDSEGKLTMYNENEYDEAGRLIKWSIYTADGELLSYWVSEYDDQGNRTSYVQYNPDGSVSTYLEEE